MSKLLSAFILAAALAGPAGAANLTAVSASVNDVTGAARTTFSTGESITLRQSVRNAVTSASQIAFKFTIQSPSGTSPFVHTGNAAPGTAGGAQTQLAGIPISAFYSVPGQYTFKAEAALDAETVTQLVRFTISSPNITLVYPPYGARGLSDSPITFRWVASGATRYRITVADNAGLYNPVHTGVNSGENSYSYPTTPTQPREQLVPGQIYYWRVDGVDAANNTISQSTVYNFTIQTQASAQTRDLAITSLALAGAVSDYSAPLTFKAVLLNNGSTAESNVSVRMTLGGLAAAESPKPVTSIRVGEQQTITFTAYMPPDQEQSLAAACVDLFDDNIPDNCKTMLVSKNTGAAAAAAGGTGSKLSYDEMFQAILKRLGPDAAAALDGYTFESLNCANCSQSELTAIITALISGDAQIVNASVSDAGGAAAPAAKAGAALAAAAASEAPPEAEEPLELAPLKKESHDEWTGYTEALKSKEPAVYVIKSLKDWKKLWKTVSAEEEPAVDFDRKMVVGIISSPEDRAQTVRIMGKRTTDDGIAFDYYMVEAPAGEQLPGEFMHFSAYVFKVFDKDDAKAEFKRLDVTKK